MVAGLTWRLRAISPVVKPSTASNTTSLSLWLSVSETISPCADPFVNVVSVKQSSNLVMTCAHCWNKQSLLGHLRPAWDGIGYCNASVTPPSLTYRIRHRELRPHAFVVGKTRSFETASCNDCTPLLKMGIQMENTLHSASSTGPEFRLRTTSKTPRGGIAGRVCCEVLVVTCPPCLTNLSIQVACRALRFSGPSTVSLGWQGVHAEKESRQVQKTS